MQKNPAANKTITFDTTEHLQTLQVVDTICGKGDGRSSRCGNSGSEPAGRYHGCGSIW